ncbi:MAG: RHS repeat protein [Chloroflexi bacterium]|nr:RHS repeat protein [Chloroflexota bacterium]
MAGDTPIHDLPVPLDLALPYEEPEVGDLPFGSLAVRTLDATTGFWERLPGTVDPVNRVIRAQASHLSVFSAGAGQTADNPFDFGVNWTKTDPFTGNVAVAMPFELPPAPGGLVPDLKLVYSSQASHMAQRADRLDNNTGKQSASWVGEGFQVPIGAVQRIVDTLDNEHFTLEIFGQSFRLTQDASSAWRTEDEQFWKIDRDGTEGTVSFKWRVIKPDGTKYYFGIDAGQLDQAVTWDFATSSHVVRSWMLSRVQDPNGNLVRIDWCRLTKNLNCGGQTGTMTPSVYPTTLRYGGQDWANLPVSVTFVRSSGTCSDVVGQTSTDRVDGGGAWATNGCAQSVFDVKYLDRLEVRVSGSLARVYKFGLAYWANPLWLEEVWLQDDVAGTTKQLLLKTAWTEPALTDTDTIVNDGSESNSYRLLASLQNGFGAAWSFTYQFVQAANHQDYHGPNNTLWEGRVCRATQESVSPGFGGTTIVTDHLDYRDPAGNGNANWPEFRGHSHVHVRQAGFDTVMDFHQDARKGRPTSIVHKDTGGTTVKTVTNTWGTEVINGGGTFVRLDRTDEIMGTTTPRTTRTFSYDAAQQGGSQYGNQTDVREWGSADPAVGQWYRHTATEFRPRNQTSPSVVYIVSKPARTRLFANDGANGDGDWQSEAWHCYDGSRTWDAQPAATGLLTLVRRRLDGGSPPDDRLADVAYGYDAWGNRTSITEYGDYGSVANPNTVPGDARTTAFVFDATLHAYRTSETNALSQQTQYAYDTTKNRLTRVTDPNGAVTDHGYDALGRRTATWLPGDAVSNPGCATVTYRYAVRGGQPTRIQVGRRRDAGGGTTGKRAFEWQLYDGLGRLIQRQADFDRSLQVIRASDVNDLRQKLIDYGETFSFGPVAARVDPVRASHYTELRANPPQAGLEHQSLP